MTRLKYVQVKDGDLVFPRMDGWKMRCCDCGLTHTFVFAVVKRDRKNVVVFRVALDNRATAATRRRKYPLTPTEPRP